MRVKDATDTAGFVDLVDEASGDQPVSNELFEAQAGWSANDTDVATG